MFTAWSVVKELFARKVLGNDGAQQATADAATGLLSSLFE